MALAFRRWCWLSVLCVATPLQAWGTEPTAFSWSRLPGAEDCPALAEVSARIDQQLRRRAFVAPSEASLLFEASIAPRDAGGFVVRIVLLRPGKQTLGTRELELPQADCSAAVDAAALALALMVDPDADVHPSTASMPSPPAPPVPPAPVAEPPAPPAPATKTQHMAQKPAAACPAPGERWSVRLGAGPWLGVGMLPEPGFGGVVSAQAAPPRQPLSVEVAGGYLAPRRLQARSDAGADFWATYAQLNGAWTAVLGPSVRWSVGAGFWAAVIEAEAFGFTSSYYDSAWQIGAGLHAELHVALGEHWGLQVRPTLLLPVKRETFDVRSSSGTEPLFTSAPVQLALSTALAFTP